MVTTSVLNAMMQDFTVGAFLIRFFFSFCTNVFFGLEGTNVYKLKVTSAE